MRKKKRENITMKKIYNSHLHLHSYINLKIDNSSP